MASGATMAASEAAAPGCIAGPLWDGCTAMDCSPQGVVAYSCGPLIPIVDAATMQVVQTLQPPLSNSRPPPPVTALKFQAHTFERDSARPPPLLLAAGDRDGGITVWEALREEVVHALRLPESLLPDPPSSSSTSSSSARDYGHASAGTGVHAGSVVALQWVFGRPWLLAAVYWPSVAVVWDVAGDAARVAWHHEVSSGEQLIGVQCDPHDTRHVCVMGSRGLLLSVRVTGGEGERGGGGGGGARKDGSLLSIQHVPLQLPLGDAGSAGAVAGFGAGGGADGAGRRGGGGASASSTSERGSAGGGGASAAADSGGGSAPPALSFVFAPHTRDLLFVLRAREVLAFDLRFGSAVGASQVPRSHARMQQLMAAGCRDVLLCTHADGKMSLWERRA